MTRKVFMGGFPPVWVCKICEYRQIDERIAKEQKKP